MTEARASGAVVAGFAALLAAPQLAAWHATGGPLFDDDAAFYFVIARNLAAGAGSTFDGLVPTNGYHPLWQGVLAALFAVAGPRPWLVPGVELALLSGGLALLLRPLEGWAAKLVFAAALGFALRSAPLRGMEVSLAVATFAGLVAALREGARGPVVGLLAAAAIGARLDAAVFVLPLVAAATHGRRRAEALAVVGALALAYAAGNQLWFGLPGPVSGAVKSLGGLQLNRPLLANTPALYAFELGGLGVLAVAGLAASARPGVGDVERALGRTFPLGLALFAAKLVFGSSWIVWSWYFYPLAFGVLAPATVALQAAAPFLAGSPPVRTTLGLGAAALALLGAQLRGRAAASGRDYSSFSHVNERFAAEYAPRLGRARLAVGDRAGTLGWAWPGSVTHLEGLVNDRDWLRVLRGDGDPNAVLCARGVAYVGDWRAPGEALSGEVEVETLRAVLTQAPAPPVRVWAQDEVARVTDPRFHDEGEGHDALVVWRLRCPP